MRKRAFLQGLTASGLMCACGQHALGQQRHGRFCGFVDPPATGGGLVPQAFGLKGASRGKSALTWSFAGTVTGVGNASKVNPILSRAFGIWRAPVPALSFTQVASGADIAITVANLGASNPTTGLQTLGTTTQSGQSIQITNQATFGATAAALGAAGGNSLLSIVTHEIGHALGLLHATTNTSIMFAVSSNQETLGPDDTAGIKALYGWSPQTKLQGGTEQAPSLCTCGGTLAMVWRGSGSDRNIWISTSTDGKNWTPQRNFRDVGTIGSPALAWDGARLWMAWRGTGDDQGLYFKTSTDFFVRDNPPQQKIGGTGSSHGPRIAIVSGVPTMAWKGVSDDHGIYFSRFVAGRWQPQAKVPGVGTEAAPAICQDLAGGIRLLWRGVGNDHQMWTTFSTGPAPNWQPQTTLTWNTPGNGGTGTVTRGTAGTDGGPSLVLVGNVIQAAWRGVPGDQGLWFTQIANDVLPSGATALEWSTQANVPNVGSSDGPSLASFKGSLHMAWKGVKNDTGLFTATL